jgi:hypothetical protein
VATWFLVCEVWGVFTIAIVATIVICLHFSLYKQTWLIPLLLHCLMLSAEINVCLLFLLFSDEAYSVLGFPLWRSTRCSGKCMPPSPPLCCIAQLPHPNLFPGFLCFAVDSVCKTCHWRFNAPHPDIRKIFACGHNNVDKVCEMCYLGSDVLHPYPGEFTFGYHDP